MRWQMAGLCALSLVAMTSCADDFAKGGRIDRAVYQDMVELHRKDCSPAELDMFCRGKKLNSEECVRMCGKQ
jgi:hypothetical protein